MDKITINLENCFGIGKFNYTFDFNLKDTFLLYAPNGTMKTSFAKTMDLISKNDPKNKPRDLIHNKSSKYEVVINNTPINPNRILVINAEDTTFDATHKITSFIASKELKEKYDLIYDELHSNKSDLLKKLKNISASTNCEEEYIETFKHKYNTNNFFEILLQHGKSLQENLIKIDFKYNHVFDPKKNVQKFLEKNKNLLNDYIEDYNNILSNSRLFKSTAKNTFGTYQASEILKSIDDNSFFDAGHKFILEDGTEIISTTSLKELFEEEINKIIEDNKLKDTFNKVDKAIGSNIELRAFKKVIEKDNSILVELKDYEKFQQKVWTSFLVEIKNDVEFLNNLYLQKKSEIEDIINQTKNEIELWKDITEKFNSRFHVPFDVEIANQQDVLLKQETPTLEFLYKDKKEEPIKQSKENLLKVLSKGEQRAYFILHFLFEIESRKLNEDSTLIVFDDIADSFDYKNKYAIIEYISDLQKTNNFMSLILTHNFDFYRTISSRLNLNKSSFIVSKDENRNITLLRETFSKNVFKELITNISSPKSFISLIPFIRNIIEYTDSNKCTDYNLLTESLHIKNSAQSITIGQVLDIYKNRITRLDDSKLQFDTNLDLHKFIFSIADDILNEKNIDEILLENKITLAIACRLKIEQYMISKLPNVDLNSINYNQTRELSKLYRIENKDSDNLSIIDKVNLMTPENIHINSFMYEPLIDMSVFHLIELYNSIIQIKVLN